MNRLFPRALLFAALCLVAAKPSDQPPSPEPEKPSAEPSEPTELDLVKIKALMDQRMEMYVARCSEALPEERDAVRAALVGRGTVWYDGRGRVKSLSCEEATDADVKLFAALPRLDSLYIGAGNASLFIGRGTMNVTDAGLLPLLTKAHQLRALRLRDTQMTDEGLKVIAQLTKLESLSLSSYRVTDPGMAHLNGLKHLSSLNLIGSSVGDDGMRKVADHRSLRALGVGGRVTSHGLAELVRLTFLADLWIERDLSDDDMLAVGQMKNLEVLRCGLLGLTDEGLRRMKDLKRLRSLALDRTHATDAGMAYVAQMKGLEKLSLNPGVGDVGIRLLGALTNLRELKLMCPQVTDAGMAQLIALRELRRLGLTYTHVTAAGVAQLGTLDRIEYIDLDYTEISDQEAAILQRGGIPVSKLRGRYPPWLRR